MSVSERDDEAGSGGRREARVRETRARLVEAGRRLFVRHGPRGVTSHSIAAEAGYAAGTFYLHFKDKHELFREIGEDAATELEARVMAAALGKTEPEDVLYAQADALVGFTEEHRDLVALVFHPEGESGAIAARILERLAAGVSARRRERVARQTAADCFHPDVLAQAIVGMWAHVLAWWAEDPRRADRAEIVRTLTHFHLHGSRGHESDLCGLWPDPCDEPESTPEGVPSR